MKNHYVEMERGIKMKNVILWTIQNNDDEIDDALNRVIKSVKIDDYVILNMIEKF
jgi:hypothetical protein